MTSQGDVYRTMPLIRRIQPTSDATPPWAGISFVEPVDSDALHEHLKMSYPQCATFRERKHMATIDFLTAELHQMQSKGCNSTSVEHTVEYQALAHPQSPSLSSEGFGGRSRQGSVALSQMSLSSTQLSTCMEHALHDRHSSTTAARVPPMRPSTGDFGQHIVFNAVDGRTMKPKTKRKMTTEEKNAYKETRKRGACPKCKRQKGKVCHCPLSNIEWAHDPILICHSARTQWTWSRDLSVRWVETHRKGKVT